jgi:hypothetical protein
VAAQPNKLTAFYALFKFNSGLPGVPYNFSTEISVVPDVLPYGPQYSIGTGTDMLDANFYKDGGASATPVRYAMNPSPSNKGRFVAFWGTHSQTNKSGLFMVTSGRPSSWLRLTTDQDAAATGPIVWTPDDQALIVGKSRLALPAAGQTSPFQDITLHGLAAKVLSATDMYTNNYAAALVNGNIALLPILPTGFEDLSRQPVFVTNFAAGTVQIQNVNISGDGSTLAFDDVHAGAQRDTGDVYSLHNLATIRGASKLAGNISSLAPTTLNNDNLFSIRGIESDNFAFKPYLSDDGTRAYYSEDWSNTYKGDATVTNLFKTQFDPMVSYSDGTEADARLADPTGTVINQVYAAFTRGGTRALYTQPTADMPHLMVAPIRVSTLASTGLTDLAMKSAMDVYSLQQFDSDGSATVNVPAGVDVVFVDANQKISIETPVVPELYGRIPVGVADLPVVRVVSPSTATIANGYAQLVLRYSDAEIGGLDESKLKVYRLDGAANVYRPVDAANVVLDMQTNTFKVNITNFGTYAIGGPGMVDDDRDGMSNYWEAFYGLDPYNGADRSTDTDGDGLTALQESQAGGAPNMKDTDGDGYSDLIEYRAGSSLSNADSKPGPPTNGDLDRNGKPDAIDLQIVINAALWRKTPCPADLNGDGLVTAVDVQMMANFVLRGGLSAGHYPTK